MVSNKQNLREQASLIREGVSPSDHDVKDVHHHIESSISISKTSVIAGYYPIESEFDCLSLMRLFSHAGYSCALPKVVERNKALLFFRWFSEIKMEEGAYGIKEPVGDQQPLSPDIILVPLLSFDRHLNRLGYGGGYYDRTLEQLRIKKTITAIGIAYDEQLSELLLPIEDHDQALDWIITPQNVYSATQIIEG